MALTLLWRNYDGTFLGHDRWVTAIALITLVVDGGLFIVKSKECP
jgi:hypothetical protein